MKKQIGIVAILLIAMLLVSCSSNDSQPVPDQVPVVDQVPADQPSENPVEQPAQSPSDSTSGQRRLSETYQNMMDDGKYTMKYKIITNMNDDDDNEMEIRLAVMDGMSAITMDLDDLETTTINRDNKIYIVNHENRTIMVMNQGAQVAGEDSSTSPEDLNDYDMEYVGSGRENFMGKERPYEEYSFEGGSTKYYFDGNDLDGMIITIGDNITIMEIEEISDTVNETLFELPLGYQEIKLGM